MIKNIKAKIFAGQGPLKGHLLSKIIQNFSSDFTNGKNLISKLDSRSLLIMHGPETYKTDYKRHEFTIIQTHYQQERRKQTRKEQFLNKKELENDRVSLYTLFLNPKGKLITDAFIYKPKIFQNDVHSSAKKDLFFHLKKYMWKKQVQLVDVDAEPDEQKPTLYAGYNHISTLGGYLDEGMEIAIKEQEFREEEYANLMMYDPRGGNYGRRIICMQQQIGLPASSFELMPQSTYDEYERTIGFTSTQFTRNKLPFQFNYDFLNAISFKKGCYLGQEIVSRSYFTGIVRRRVFPFVIDPSFNLTQEVLKQLKEGCRLLNENNQQIGKIVDYQKGSKGLALAPYLNYFPEVQSDSQKDNISENEAQSQSMMSVRIAAPFEGALYCPFHQTLQNYIKETRSKQKTLQELDI